MYTNVNDISNLSVFNDFSKFLDHPSPLVFSFFFFPFTFLPLLSPWFTSLSFSSCICPNATMQHVQRYHQTSNENTSNFTMVSMLPLTKFNEWDTFLGGNYVLCKGFMQTFVAHILLYVFKFADWLTSLLWHSIFELPWRGMMSWFFVEIRRAGLQLTPDQRKSCRSFHTSSSLSKEDYYKVLGVPKTATAKEIKKAYYQVQNFCLHICCKSCASSLSQLLYWE